MIFHTDWMVVRERGVIRGEHMLSIQHSKHNEKNNDWVVKHKLRTSHIGLKKDCEVSQENFNKCNLILNRTLNSTG